MLQKTVFLLGLLNIAEILELTKVLSKIGGRNLELAWSKLHAQFSVPYVRVCRPTEFLGLSAGVKMRACFLLVLS